MVDTTLFYSIQTHSPENMFCCIIPGGIGPGGIGPGGHGPGPIPEKGGPPGPIGNPGGGKGPGPCSTISMFY